ncbi:MAG: O-antigen ligase family protein [Clostridia bacterium]|nr:O-antigen ligase family protein [Clostridia bacterium]
MTAAFFLGGLGYSQYDPQNIVYCAVLFVAFFLLYFILIGTVQWREVSKDYWAWLGLFVGLTVVLQLVNVYVVNDVLRGGEIFRGNIYTGWGQYPPMAAVLLLCLPCPFYLAATKRFGFVFNLLGCGMFLAIVATTSRAAMLFGALILAACAIVTLFVKKNRIQNTIVYGVLAVGVLVVAICFWSEIKKIFTSIIELGIHDNGRGELYTEALQRFISSPLFGQGFFACSPDRWQYNPGEFTLLPYFWHNTLIQMLATSGIIGLTAYIFHRLQTVLLIVQKPNLAKTFIGLSVLGMLLVCLLDCHIFNVGVTFMYTIFLTFAEATEEMESNETCK